MNVAKKKMWTDRKMQRQWMTKRDGETTTITKSVPKRELKKLSSIDQWNDVCYAFSEARQKYQNLNENRERKKNENEFGLAELKRKYVLLRNMRTKSNVDHEIKKKKISFDLFFVSCMSVLTICSQWPPQWFLNRLSKFYWSSKYRRQRPQEENIRWYRSQWNRKSTRRIFCLTTIQFNQPVDALQTNQFRMQTK